MRDIILNSWFKKTTYVCGFIGMTIFILPWLWIIGLATYGKNTSDNTEFKKGILNKSWQKFIFCLGFYFYFILILVIIVIIIGTVIDYF